MHFLKFTQSSCNFGNDIGIVYKSYNESLNSKIPVELASFEEFSELNEGDFFRIYGHGNTGVNEEEAHSLPCDVLQ